MSGWGNRSAKFWVTVAMVGVIAVVAEPLLSQGSQPQSTSGLLAGIFKLNEQVRGQSQQDEAPSQTLLKQRLALVEQLIRTDPSQARSVMLDDAALAAFHRNPSLTDLVETGEKQTGTLEETIADDFEHHTSAAHWFLHSLNRHVEIFVPQPRGLEALLHRTVTAFGVSTAHVMAVESLSMAEALSGAGPAPSQCSTTGPQQTAIILLNFPTGGPQTPAGLDASYWMRQYTGSDPSLTDYWDNVSNGQTSASPTVFGPYTLGQTFTCDQLGPIEDAAFAAAAQDIDFSQFNRYALMFPVGSTCSYGGEASIGCGGADSTVPQPFSMVWVAEFSDYSSSQDLSGLLAHEHGHNLGLNHSNSLDFGSIPLGPIDYTASNPGTISASPPVAQGNASAPANPAAVNTEYGDPFSVMGNAYGDGPYHAFDRTDHLEWIPGGETAVVTSPGTFTITPLENSSGLRAFRVLRDPFSGSFLWLEYRQPLGYYDTLLGSELGAQNTNLYDGALIQYENGYVTNGHTFLLDFNPTSTPNDFETSDLLPGQTWSDPYTLLDLTVNSATSSGLNVTVNYDQPCATLQLSSPTYPYAGGPGTLTITAPSSCSWQVSTGTSWITPGATVSGSGNASIPFTVAASTATEQQQGFITVQRQSIPVIQQGPNVTIYNVSPEVSSGTTQEFSFTAVDTIGISDLEDIYFQVGNSATGYPLCYVTVIIDGSTANPRLFLASNVSEPTIVPGSNQSISNGQCTLYGQGSSVTFSGNSGNQVLVQLNLSFPSSSAGTYQLYVSASTAEGFAGYFPSGIFTVPDASDVVLSASPWSLPLGPGKSVTSTITVTPVGTFQGSVNLSASGLPAGVTASFNPASTAQSSILTLSATSAATLGSAIVTVTGTSGNLNRTASLDVMVTNATTPTVTVTPTPLSINTLQSVTVAIGVGGSPTATGSVTLSSGTYVSQKWILASGSVSIVVPAGVLPIGSDTLTASYTPDSNSSSIYNSASGTTSVTVSLPPPGFTVSGTTISVIPGATTGNTSTLTLTPTYGFTGAISLSCAVNPATLNDEPTCSVPTSVTITGATAQTATLTVSTTAATSSLNQSRKLFWPSVGSAALACILLIGIPARRRRWQRILGLLVLLFSIASGVFACGGSGGGGGGSGGGGGGGNAGTTAGTYTIIVTGTSGTTSEIGSVTLTVQ